MPTRSTVEKPSIASRKVYLPRGRAGIVNRPTSFETVVRTSFVWSFRISTETPGMRSPWSS
jgi:hypothetical protein